MGGGGSRLRNGPSLARLQAAAINARPV